MGLHFTLTHPPEPGRDACRAEFTIIVTLIASIQDFLIIASFHNTPFRFDVGIIPGLVTTASHCRDEELRAEAVRLLFNAPEYR
jgi:hypothetical protein